MILILPLLIILVTHVSSLQNCLNCGTLQVPYPLSTNTDCGDSRYKIYCNNNVPQFKSSTGEFYYNILSIDPSAYKLVISPPQIQKDTCYSSDLFFGGLRLDENSPFNVSTRNTVMLLNCSDLLINSPLNCSANSLCRQFEEKVEEAKRCKNMFCCSYLKDSAMTSRMIRVRVGGCTAYTSVVGLKPGDPFDAWNYGIELQWLPPN